MLLSKVLVLAGLLVMVCFSAIAQGFINLGFESAIVRPVVSGSDVDFLAWEEAVPGWAHSIAEDTQYVYYRNFAETHRHIFVRSAEPGLESWKLRRILPVFPERFVKR
jgi:hypothetical protein